MRPAEQRGQTHVEEVSIASSLVLIDPVLERQQVLHLRALRSRDGRIIRRRKDTERSSKRTALLRLTVPSLSSHCTGEPTKPTSISRALTSSARHSSRTTPPRSPPRSMRTSSWPSRRSASVASRARWDSRQASACEW